MGFEGLERDGQVGFGGMSVVLVCCGVVDGGWISRVVGTVGCGFGLLFVFMWRGFMCGYGDLPWEVAWRRWRYLCDRGYGSCVTVGGMARCNARIRRARERYELLLRQHLDQQRKEKIS